MNDFIPKGNSKWTAQAICTIIPFHVKQLTTSIKDLNEAQIILQQLSNLSRAHFIDNFNESMVCSFIEWLAENKPNSSNYTKYCSVIVWLA